MERVQGILTRLLEGQALGGALAGMRVIGLWPSVVGPEVAQRTCAAGFREKCLIVEVFSSVWMNQLTFLKAEILGRLTEAIGPGVVSDIQFVMAGRREPGRRGSAPGAPSRGARAERVRDEDSPGRTRPEKGRGHE